MKEIHVTIEWHRKGFFSFFYLTSLIVPNLSKIQNVDYKTTSIDSQNTIIDFFVNFFLRSFPRN